MSSLVNLKIESPFAQQKNIEKKSKYFPFTYQIFQMAFLILYNFETIILEPALVILVLILQQTILILHYKILE